jgi:vacuolar-type H+-ATPase subunit H
MTPADITRNIKATEKEVEERIVAQSKRHEQEIRSLHHKHEETLLALADSLGGAYADIDAKQDAKLQTTAKDATAQKKSISETLQGVSVERTQNALKHLSTTLEPSH